MDIYFGALEPDRLTHFPPTRQRICLFLNSEKLSVCFGLMDFI